MQFWGGIARAPYLTPQRSCQGSKTAAGGECVLALVLDSANGVIRSLHKQPARFPISPGFDVFHIETRALLRRVLIAPPVVSCSTALCARSCTEDTNLTAHMEELRTLFASGGLASVFSLERHRRDVR